MRVESPLRYPGGKGVLFERLRSVIYENSLQGGTYIEPFAGGAGAALKLLYKEHVDSIVINDYDYRIYAFWKSALEQRSRFAKKIAECEVTLDEWHKQRKIYLNPKSRSLLSVGFATFFLNRCNRSGILVNGGPIGGQEQTGKWKIDARFNKEELVERLVRLSENRHRIEVRNLDALSLLQKVDNGDFGKRTFTYLDPPYFVKGEGLYLNAYKQEDHKQLANFMKSRFTKAWVMTYDNVPEIREMYSWALFQSFDLRYSAYESRKGSEVLIAPKSIYTSAFGNIP